ncbi:hypothetical protein BH006_07680 [Salmonella enterica]|uniref:Uncharacterized protein n=1 Tax=Salmonella enterica TaxID=28901 RepID=A0A3F3IGI7_SALER|nr:hypothetical protein [Salmonella enterica]OEH95294.1 hypothetical protein BH006_07680 [Salmonella enterica]
MDKFDRSTQRELLQLLYDAHPFEIPDDALSSVLALFGSEQILLSNLIYLEEHGLIKNAIDYTLDGPEVNIPELRITKDGIDFLRDDGGLNAILNVLTLRLHNETLSELERVINSSTTATTEDKSKLISQLRSLPADAIKQLTIRLLGQGLDRLPDVFQLIQKALQTV